MDRTSYSREYTWSGGDPTPSVVQLTFKAFIALPIVFAVLAVILLLISFGVRTFRENKKADFTESVNAVVTELKVVPSDKGSSTYKAVFGYTYDGKEYSTNDSVSQYPAAYEVGEEVPILINPDKPSEIYTDSTDNLMNIFIWMFLGVGCFFALIAIILFVVYAANTKKSKAAETDELSEYYK